MRAARRSSFSNVPQQVLENFQKLFAVDPEKLASGEVTAQFPTFNSFTIINLLIMVKNLFNAEDVIIKAKSPMVVVGDLHGHIIDLLRIIKLNGFPLNKRYLFLGDIVDRGQFSFETLILVFAMKINWPQNVIIIRGNHEFDFTCKNSGFLAELKALYKDYESLYESFLDVFASMPFGCIIDNKYLAVHGGIGPNFTKIEQLAAIKRPITDFGLNTLDEVLWSDPNIQVRDYERSPRGTGVLYGIDAVNKFLQDNKITTIIRGHENTYKGIEILFNGKVITVFSASNYCGIGNNNAGILLISGAKVQPVIYGPLPYVYRNQVQYLPAP